MDGGYLLRFEHNGLNLRVRLGLFTQDINRLPHGYRRFWIERVEKVAEE
ncbi:MAG: hypothetical protein N3D16_07435 [Anaerolineales bacterium]|nr:hypothetical protein [Anaerolineales bacterium]